MPLFLVRHGQTDWNLEKRFQSRTDVPLNETGRSQARQVRDALRREGVRFRAASCSPLGRAAETAGIVLQDTGLDAWPDADLMELSVGDFEGQLESTLKTSLGDGFDQWRDGCFTEPAPNGESLFEAMQRAERALNLLIGEAHGENSLMVAHQGINMAVLATLSKRTDIESLVGFRQANDEVEVWDTEAGVRLRKFKV